MYQTEIQVIKKSAESMANRSDQCKDRVLEPGHWSGANDHTL